MNNFTLVWLPDPETGIKKCTACGEAMPPTYEEFIEHMKMHHVEHVKAEADAKKWPDELPRPH